MLGAANVFHFALDGELVKGAERQREEESYSAVEYYEGIAKRPSDLFRRTLYCGRIGNCLLYTSRCV